MHTYRDAQGTGKYHMIDNYCRSRNSRHVHGLAAQDNAVYCIIMYDKNLLSTLTSNITELLLIIMEYQNKFFFKLFMLCIDILSCHPGAVLAQYNI